MTRSGARARPLAPGQPAARSRSRGSASRCAARSRFGRLRACGTSPWIAATTAVGSPAAPPSPGSSAPAARSAAIAASASAGQRARDGGVAADDRPPPRPPAGPSSSHARQAAVSAMRKVRNGGPPIATQRAVGADAWLMTSRPHGKPSQGHRSRSASAATHQPATASGQARSRSSSHCPSVSTAKMAVSAMARAAQTYHATLTSQDRSGKKKATPKTTPTASAVLARCRRKAMTSRAGPTTASGQMPAGGKAAASARPPASAVSIARAAVMGGAAGGRAGRAADPTAGPGLTSRTVPPLAEDSVCRFSASVAGLVTWASAAAARPTAPPRVPGRPPGLPGTAVLVQQADCNLDTGGIAAIHRDSVVTVCLVVNVDCPIKVGCARLMVKIRYSELPAGLHVVAEAAVAARSSICCRD